MRFLFLQPTDAIHIDSVELAAALLLVGGELLVDGFEPDSGIVADTHDDDATVLVLALVVLLVGEGDVDLGYIVRGMGRRVGVREHRLAVLEIDNARAAGHVATLGVDGEAAGVARPLDVLVLREGIVGTHLLHAPFSGSPNQEQEPNKDDAEEEDSQGDNHEINHGHVVGVVAPEIASHKISVGDHGWLSSSRRVSVLR